MISLAGHHSFFVVYDYDTIYIFADPVSNLTYATKVGVFDKVFTEPPDAGVKPRFNVIVNQATGPLKSYMVKHDCKLQFLEPSSHHVNAAERAIQALKNNFISDMCSSNTRWPVQLWDHLSTQAVITINLLHILHINTVTPAYHQLHGHR